MIVRHSDTPCRACIIHYDTGEAEVDGYEEGDKVPQNNDPTDERILKLSKAAGADLRPLIHFWGVQPEDPKTLAEQMKKAGLEPIPVKYDKIWEYYHSGPDCSDSDIWRENDPIKLAAHEPSPDERLV